MPDRRLIQFARQMRKAATDAERRIWSYLRADRLDGHTFRRQHPIGPYIADFYCHVARLVVELDGGQHRDPEAVVYDDRRTAYMASQGIAVARFSDIDVLKHSDAVAEAILRAVERRLVELGRVDKKSPLPSPPPAYRERGQEGNAH